MSTSTGTRKERTVQSRSSEAIIENDKLLIDSFKVFADAGNSVAGTTGAPVANNSPTTPAGNYLAREGDSMIGPFALGPPLDFSIEVDANNTIDIGPLNDNSQYSSNLQLDDLQPNSSVLDIIANAAFDGQKLVLRTFAPTVPYTISQGTLGNGGNIQTGDGNDLTVGDLQTIELIFDESLKINANTGGTWRIQSVSSGSAGITEPIILTINTITPQTPPTKSTIDWSKNPNHITLDRAVEFDFSNLPANGRYEGVLVIIDVDSTGGYTAPVWPAAVLNPPVVSTAADTRTSVMLYTIDGGTVVTHATSVGSSTGGAFATTQLDNLSSPVLNTSIDFDSNAPTNFNGYVSQIVGNTLVNDASGATWTLPAGDTYKWNVNGLEQLEVTETAVNVKNNGLTEYVGYTAGVGQTVVLDAVGESHTLPSGDLYDFKINGISEFTISSVGIGVQNSITLQDSTADPATNGEIQRNGTDVKVFTGGSVLNLSNVPEYPVSDALWEVEDDIDDTRTLKLQVGGIAASTTRTWTAQNASGTVTLLDGGLVQRFVDSITPSTDGTTDWGDSTHHLNQLFTEQITFRALTGPALSTTQYITGDADGIRINIPNGDDITYLEGGTEMMLTSIVSDKMYFRAPSGKDIGWIPSTDALGNVGGFGTTAIPYDTGSVGSAANADTDFGDVIGCMGIYLNTVGVGNPTLCIKIDDGSGTDNRWSAITINRTTGALTGGILT